MNTTLRSTVIGLMLWLLLSTATATDTPPRPNCAASATHDAIRLGQRQTDNDDWLSRLLRADDDGGHVEPGEVYGSHRFEQQIPMGWTFALVPDTYGWSIRLYSEDPAPVDLSAITPPFGAATPNPRQLAGWHFRNATNTGPNAGSVNAPQALRLFAFDPRLSGTGGFRPPRTGETAPEAPGRGWLRVLDSGLADLGPGKRARLTYLKFDGCLSWPRPMPQTSAVDDSVRELAGSCGVNLARFRLVTEDLTPTVLQGDLDGDGAFDHIYRLRERDTGAAVLALCRGGTWLSLLEAAQQPEAVASTIQALERWRLLPRNFAQPGSGAGGARDPRWPEAAGEILVLERLEKSLVLVFWQDGLQVEPIFRIVSE